MKYIDPNPRMGVLLRCLGASVRLYNQLNPRCGRIGLKRFLREWPETRLIREIPRFGWKSLYELRRLLDGAGEQRKKRQRTAAVRK